MKGFLIRIDINSVSSLEQRILSTIAASESPLSANAILANVKCKTSLIYSTLHSLFSRNLVTTSGLGVKGNPKVYALNVAKLGLCESMEDSTKPEKEEYFF